jgi:hypothetical protein
MVSVVADATIVGGFAVRAISAGAKLGYATARITIEGFVAGRVTYGMQRAVTGVELDIWSAAGRARGMAKNARDISPYSLFGQTFGDGVAGNTVNATEIVKSLIPVVGSIDALGDARDSCRKVQ